jgi:ribokinase
MNIVVVGSTNTDMVVRSDHLPAPGETILGGKFLMNQGGKGANQAVAASRLGGEVLFISRIGDDIFGKQAIQNLKNEGIDIRFVSVDPENPSGVALITVDKKSENCIVVAPGSNMNLKPEEIKKAMHQIEMAKIVLLQLEIPIDTVEFVIQIAKRNKQKVILNPAPATELNPALLKGITIITPNETEAEILTGIPVKNAGSAKKAAGVLHSYGIDNVLITMGARGTYIFTNKYSEMIPAPKVNPVDTTAAGDTFNGALAVAVSEDMDILNAVQFANQAAAISVTRFGAQASTPYRSELLL